MLYPRPLPFWPCSSVGRATVIKSEGRGFKSHPPGLSFLYPCVGPIAVLGLISDGIIGYIKLHSSVRPHSNLESLLSICCNTISSSNEGLSFIVTLP